MYLQEVFVLVLLLHNSQLIKYELVQTLANYNYEKSNLDQEVITSVPNAFSITIKSDVPILRPGMLQIAPETYYFWLDSHKLKVIEPGTFDGQNITEEIRLESNNLTAIRKGTFRGLKIKQLDLAYNQIEILEEGAFEDLPNLWIVHLSRNKISAFNGQIFVNTPKVWSLDLGINKLRKIEEGSFRFMTQEKSAILGLASNEIEEIDAGAFNGVVLWNLALNDNHLKSIPKEVFSKNDFQLLELGNNLLEELSEAFFEQKNLTNVGLKKNPLKCEMVKKLKTMLESGVSVLFDINTC